MTNRKPDTGIELIVFDLGKVLVEYSYRNFFSRLRRAGAQIAEIDDFAHQVDLRLYEEGKISTQQFLSNINQQLTTTIEGSTLSTYWCQMFTPMPQMLEFARRCHKHYQTAILSNIGELHWSYLIDRFRLDRLFSPLLASFKLGVMKPDPRCYQLATEQLQLSPQQILFIDDRIENVIGAQNCGWRALQHQSYGQTLATMQAFNLHV